MNAEDEFEKIDNYLVSNEFREFRKNNSVEVIQKHLNSKKYIFHEVLVDERGNPHIKAISISEEN